MIAEATSGKPVGAADPPCRHQHGPEEDDRPPAAARLVSAYLRRRRIIDRCRVGFLGVKREYQRTGVAAGLYAGTSTRPSGTG